MPPLSRPHRTRLQAEQSAFSFAVEAHRGALEAHCRRLLGSPEDAQDALQETMLRAWRSRATFRGDASVRSWLYRIATNVCFDLRRGRANVAQQLDEDDPPAEAPASSPEPEDELIARETTELAMIAAIRHLPPKQRGALVLHGVLGYSAQETGRILESSSVSVSSALQRARRTLAERLPADRMDWTVGSEPPERERALLRSYLDAIERADIEAFLGLLAADPGRRQR